MEFEFVPLVGALPLKFGMTKAEVAKIIGPPEREAEEDDDDGGHALWSPKKQPGLPLKVFYGKDGKVDEIVFEKSAKGPILKYKKIKNMLDEGELIKLLSKEDEPQDLSDIVVFLKLGLSTNNSNKRRKTIAISRRGRWEPILERSKRIEELKRRQ